MFMAFIFQVDDKSQISPKIRCDNCGAIIEDYAHGVVHLDDPSPKPGTTIEPIFHCAGCQERLHESNASRNSMPIDHFMLYLLNNIQLTPRALEEAGQKLRARSAL
jgi:hypothetical protein